MHFTADLGIIYDQELFNQTFFVPCEKFLDAKYHFSKNILPSQDE